MISNGVHYFVIIQKYYSLGLKNCSYIMNFTIHTDIFKIYSLILRYHLFILRTYIHRFTVKCYLNFNNNNI